MLPVSDSREPIKEGTKKVDPWVRVGVDEGFEAAETPHRQCEEKIWFKCAKKYTLLLCIQNIKAVVEILHLCSILRLVWSQTSEVLPSSHIFMYFLSWKALSNLKC